MAYIPPNLPEYTRMPITEGAIHCPRLNTNKCNPAFILKWWNSTTLNRDCIFFPKFQETLSLSGFESDFTTIGRPAFPSFGIGHIGMIDKIITISERIETDTI